MLDMQTRIEYRQITRSLSCYWWFRGAAHNKYNLKLIIPRNLPIIFHNLQGYDGHITFKELNNFDVDIAVIPKDINKYMSITVNRLLE